jgi:hypothetical protein
MTIYNWRETVLVKKECNGKYTELKPVIIIVMPYTTPYTVLHEDNAKIFECEINQKDVDNMHNKIISGKAESYIPDLYVKKKKLYYPYIVSIKKDDITNNQKRIVSLNYEYKLDKLIGFHPFTKSKEPPEYFNIRNCTIGKFFSKFYYLYKEEVDINSINESMNHIYSEKNSYLDKYDDLVFFTGFLDILKAQGNYRKFNEIISKFETFIWGVHNSWTLYDPQENKNFYNYIVNPIFLEESKNDKLIYSNLDEKAKYVIDKLFITYDFKINDYKYYNDEELLSSKLNTLEKKQQFYELYYDLLIDFNIDKKDFKYKKYFGPSFHNKALEQYLRLEFNNLSYRKFDFATEERYDTYESSCLIRKKYHSISYSLRKTKKGELLYVEDNIIENRIFGPYPKLIRHFYLNKKELMYDYPDGIKSTCSINDEQIIMTTSGGNKPFIFDLYENSHPKVTFENFKESCYDAILLNNSLIAVTGERIFGYYCKVTENEYKIIKIYEPEEKNKHIIYLIEFNDNLLITCFVNNNLINDKDKILFDNIHIGFHKINFDKEEKKINDENKLVQFNDIVLNRSCLRYKNILVKLSNSILCVGGNTDVYLINVDNYEFVKKINIFNSGSICSFYKGEYNTIFIAYRSRKSINTFDGEFEVHKIDFCCYQFQEDSMELKYINRPSSKSREKDPCIIF